MGGGRGGGCIVLLTKEHIGIMRLALKFNYDMLCYSIAREMGEIRISDTESIFKNLLVKFKDL